MRTIWCIVALAVAAVGCEPEHAKQIITETDSAEMVLIPAGEFIMGSDDGNEPEKPAHKVYLDAYYIDKHEVTNAQYKKFVEATGHPQPIGHAIINGKRVHNFKPWENKNFNAPDQPVVCVSWEDAVAYAKWAGKRLPTEAEWEKAARGTDGEPDAGKVTRANYGSDDKFKFPAPVGSFMLGVSPYGLADMAGNVAEWCMDWYDADYYARSSLRNPQGPVQGVYRVFRGGAWSGATDIRCAARNAAEPQLRHYLIGFRCAKDVIERPRPAAAAERPAPKKTPTSEITTKKDRAAMVLVPAGTFQMGSINGDYDERPRHTVYIDAFYIDKYEVTNKQYRLFVKETGHPEPVGYGFVNGQGVNDFRPWQDSRFNAPDQPVVCVSWEDAVAYAKWAGKRLPTEAEWEKAAKGTLGASYPWGFSAPTADLARFNLDFETGYPAVVGSYPAGASPYGCLDIAGNVWEWCADWYNERYYESSPTENPPGPQSGGMGRVLRGGSWANRGPLLRTEVRFCAPPKKKAYYIGFRCALTPNKELH